MKLVPSRFPLLMAVGLLAASILAMAFFIERQGRSQDWIRHTLEVELDVSELRFLRRLAESSQRGFLLTEREAYAEQFQSSKSNAMAKLDDLRWLVSDDPFQIDVIARLRSKLTDQFEQLGETIKARRGGKLDGALAPSETDRSLALAQQEDQLFEQTLTEEQRLLMNRTADARFAAFSLQLLAIGSFIATCAIGWKMHRTSQDHVSQLSQANLALVDANHRLEEEAQQRSKLEEQLHHSRKLEAIGQLAGGIAHDFNNVLAIIVNSLYIAKRLHLRQDPRYPKFVDDAIEAAHRAASVTKHLLAFSRQQPLEPRPVDCNSLVGRLSELLHSTLGETIEIETIRAAGLWRTFADPSLLESAVLNLAVNARDAMPDGGKLTIETANACLDENYAASNLEVSPGQYVLLAISDTGHGMSREVMEQAFDPFFTTKETGKGTGLGLSQVYGFVKQSKGHVALYSEPEQGTTIRIYLPRFRGDDAADASKPKEGTHTPLGRSNQVVLAVDDDPGVLRTTVECFRELGYTVLGANKPSEALKTLSEHPEISLLFTDVVMPEMNGRALAKQALGMRPDLKVVFTTGFSRNATIHNGVLDADVQVLPKPFTLEQLAAKIGTIFSGSERGIAALSRECV